MKVLAEALTTSSFADRKGHSCYFCHPAAYPLMPAFHTLCCRCGELILTDVKGDPMNDRMEVCPKCDMELWEQFGA